MPFLEGGADGTFSGISSGLASVMVVPRPTSGVRRVVKGITLCNISNTSVSPAVVLLNPPNTRIIWSGTMLGGDVFMFGEAGDILVLDSINKSVNVVVSGSGFYDWTSSWGDAS